jgi:1,4-alpha-glucan branching enzyme
MTPMTWESYRIGVPKKGKFKLILNSCDTRFGGSGATIPDELVSEPGECNFRKFSIAFDVPPYCAAVFLF